MYLLAFLLLLYGLGFIPVNFLKDTIAAKVQEKSGIQASINGNVYFKILPIPKIVAYQFVSNTEGSLIKFDQVEAYISFTDLLSGNIAYNSFSLKYGDADLSKQGVISNLTAIKNIRLEGVNLIMPENFYLGKYLKNINGYFTASGILSKNINANVSYETNDKNYNLITNLEEIDKEGNVKNSELTIADGLINIFFQGNLNSIFTKPNFDGKFNISIDKNTANLNSPIRGIMRKILADEKLTASGLAKYDGEELVISQLKASSQNIQNGLSEIKIRLSQGIDFNVDINLESINFDALFARDLKSDGHQGFTLDYIAKTFLEGFNFKVGTTTNGFIDVALNNAQINGQKVANVAFVIDFFDGEVSLSRFDASLPGNGKIMLSGLVTHNDIRPKFVGQLLFDVENTLEFGKWIGIEKLSEVLKSETMNFRSKIHIIPRNLKLIDIKGIVGDTLFIGNYWIKHTGEKHLYNKLNLRVNNFDFDSYQFSKHIDNIAYNYYALDTDKSGNFFVDYNHDFKWLRSFPTTLALELEFNKANYKTKSISGLAFKGVVSPNKIHIDDFSLAEGPINFNMGGDLQITTFNPTVNAKVKIKKMNAEELVGIFPTIGQLKDFQNKFWAIKLGNDKQRSVDNFLSRDINLFAIHNWAGKIDLQIDEYTADNLAFSNLEALLAIEDGNLIIESINMDVFDGKLSLNGAVSSLSPIINFTISFALNNFNPSSFFKYFYGVPMLDGYFSLGGSLNSSGNDYTTILSRMAGNGQFLGRKITINSFGLGEIIRLTESKLSKAKFDEVVNYYSHYGQTIFDNMKGSLAIKQGLMAASGIQFSNNRVSGAYSANIDLPNKLVNGLGKISFIPEGVSYPISLDLRTKGDFRQQSSIDLGSNKLNDFISSKISKDEMTEKQTLTQKQKQNLLPTPKLHH